MADETLIPFVFAIDVEPDEAEPLRNVKEPWRGFEAALEAVPLLRSRLEEATDHAVRFNWYLRADQQVADVYGDAAWALGKYEEELAALSVAGDLIGLHPHAWRWDDVAGNWQQDHDNAAFVSDVINMSFDAYRRAFGVPCRAHRFGSRFISAPVLNQLGNLGVRVDSTVEPGARAMVTLDAKLRATGMLPDQLRAPRVPYRPSLRDPFEARVGGEGSADGLWELPLTSVDPDPWLPTWRRVARRVRFPGRPRHRSVQLWAPADPRIFWSTIEAALESVSRPYLAFAVRSDAFIRPGWKTPIDQKFGSLMGRELVKRIDFVTAIEAIDRLAAR